MGKNFCGKVKRKYNKMKVSWLFGFFIYDCDIESSLSFSYLKRHD